MRTPARDALAFAAMRNAERGQAPPREPAKPTQRGRRFLIVGALLLTHGGVFVLGYEWARTFCVMGHAGEPVLLLQPPPPPPPPPPLVAPVTAAATVAHERPHLRAGRGPAAERLRAREEALAAASLVLTPAAEEESDDPLFPIGQLPLLLTQAAQGAAPSGESVEDELAAAAEARVAALRARDAQAGIVEEVDGAVVPLDVVDYYEFDPLVDYLDAAVTAGEGTLAEPQPGAEEEEEAESDEIDEPSLLAESAVATLPAAGGAVLELGAGGDNPAWLEGLSRVVVNKTVVYTWTVRTRCGTHLVHASG